jgi:hypothetical protein
MALSLVEGPGTRIAATRETPACAPTSHFALRRGYGEARRSAAREGCLLDEPGQPLPVAQASGLRAEALEVIADHLVHDAL